MANSFHDQKARWMGLSKGDFDYSVFFIKCWIPFNAWYCGAYPQHKNTDSKILKEVKTDNNLFKTRIISLLNNNDEESEYFKNLILELHSKLERFNIPNNLNKISFNSICFRDNPLSISTLNSNNTRYQVELLTTNAQNNIRLRVVALRNTNTIFHYQHTKYDIDHLKNNYDFTQLSSKAQNIIIKCAEEVNPKKKECLIVGRKVDSLFGKNGTYFINNPDFIAQSLIEVLYKLRCILFHGEIIPSTNNLSVYEPAYYIMRILIQSLQ